MNYMEIANLEAKKNSKNDFKNGGPFGAVIVKDNKIIAKAKNSVLKNSDPTAHAEVNAIRKACQKLRTHDLTGAVLYSSCEPCPMCLSASIWANIKTIYYGNDRFDAEKIGFKDSLIYEHLNGENKVVDLIQVDRDKTIEVFNQFENNKNIY